jgi:hypothetical protein
VILTIIMGAVRAWEATKAHTGDARCFRKVAPARPGRRPPAGGDFFLWNGDFLCGREAEESRAQQQRGLGESGPVGRLGSESDDRRRDRARGSTVPA